MNPIGAAGTGRPISYHFAPRRSSTGSILLAVAAAVLGPMIVIGTVLLQAGVWLQGELAEATGHPVTGLRWALLTWLNAMLVGVPALVLWLFARRVSGARVVRAAAGAWTLAALALGVVGSARGAPPADNELVLLLTAFAAGSLAVIIPLVRRAASRQTEVRRPEIRRPEVRQPAVRRPGPRPDAAASPHGGAVWGGMATGLLVLVPWLWVGALGGLTETVLAVLAAAAVGGLASSILDGQYFAAFEPEPGQGGGMRLLKMLGAGAIAAVALAVLAPAIGGRGVNLAELFTLPALGMTLAALDCARSGTHSAAAARAANAAEGSAVDAEAGVAGPARHRWPVVAAIGIAALGPIAFVDPEETSLVLGLADVGYWTAIATFASVLIGLIAGAGFILAAALRRRMARGPLAALAAVALVLAGGTYALAGRPGFYGERLFVVLADQADLSGLDQIADRPARLEATYRRLVDHARQAQAPLLVALRQWHLSYTPYYLVNGVMVDGGPAVRAWLQRRPDVDRVLLDPQLRPLPVGVPTERGSSAPPADHPQWNIGLIGADRVWRDFAVQGQGIVIGTSDSGVDGAHPALRGSFRGGDDSWLDPWNATTVPTDHGGHGTHTIGTALGTGGIGVAPRAQWIGCVNLDRNAASPSKYLDCLQFMLAPYPPGADPFTAGRPQRAPDILTNSWGCPRTEGCDLNALRPAIAALRTAGIFVVAAAGNAGPGCGSVDDPPAPYPDTFTVGAVDERATVADFSSRGPTPDGVRKPDLVAPGVNILSAFPGGTYTVLDGTSMAAPHVAGVVALMWSANPRLVGDVARTERILRQTTRTAAIPPNEPSCGDPANIEGAGLVDAYAAVDAARSA